MSLLFTKQCTHVGDVRQAPRTHRPSVRLSDFASLVALTALVHVLVDSRFQFPTLDKAYLLVDGWKDEEGWPDEEGMLLGKEDGTVDGTDEGRREGIPLGGEDGIADGTKDGWFDATDEGQREGIPLGGDDGIADGTNVGWSEGIPLGEDDKLGL